jgi:hypothetical protein
MNKDIILFTNLTLAGGQSAKKEIGEFLMYKANADLGVTI